MKVAIDMRKFYPGHWYRGVGAYTKRLIQALQLIKEPDFSVQLIKQGNIPRDVDLVHYPYFDLFFLTLPMIKRRPTVVTIHDVIPLIFPEKYPKGIRGWLKFQVQKFSLQGASGIITDSKNSKKDIVKYLGFPKEKIYVVPLAPGEEFKKLAIGHWPLANKEKYQLPETFLLYVGDVNYNKNVEGLIKACAKIKIPLVLVGKAFEEKSLPESKAILQLIKQLSLNNQTKILGYVATKDLVKIYNLATAYIQPSFYEGFGLPVLEAMACGTPVVVSRAGSLPEIVGDAGIFVDPGDVEDIVRGIKEAIKKRKALIEKGFKQVKKFNWEKTARETIKVYHEV